jgi:hypothetical protein
MNEQRKKLAISGLRWDLGVVVLLEAVRFTFSSAAAHSLSKAGFPQWIRPALGGSEIIAALLFLLPAASLVGSYLLLFIFGVAMGGFIFFTGSMTWAG